ncbi:conserved hypothetical protein [Ricinus communis]|uniref:Uncharacterized protein n=1 Tax=Ricinus communis TaxID=3988 RepID=B9TDW8_RICCO|nr:conserved hypothetical protein [Ricinus communis]
MKTTRLYGRRNIVACPSNATLARCYRQGNPILETERFIFCRAGGGGDGEGGKGCGMAIHGTAMPRGTAGKAQPVLRKPAATPLMVRWMPRCTRSSGARPAATVVR